MTLPPRFRLPLLSLLLVAFGFFLLPRLFLRLTGMQPFWPLAQLCGLVAVLPLAVFLLKRQGRARLYLQAGLRKPGLQLAGVYALLAAGALVVWFLLFPDYLKKMTIFNMVEKQITARGLLTVMLGYCLGFAVLNAILEEFVFRAAILRSLLEAFPVWLALGLQGALFGIAHLQGVPGGWSGVLLATIFGIFMGDLMRRSNGILYPVLAHIMADVVIFLGLLWARGYLG